MSRRNQVSALLVGAFMLSAALAEPAACNARSAAAVNPLVELYTSEGCSSCPPADRWLSGLADDPNRVALAWHVDYWDRLGWKDRFASPAHTRRQAAQQRSNGARFSYTPQVVANGIDRPDWPRVQRAPRTDGPAALTIELGRVGDLVTARVQPGPTAPARLSAYWAVTEDGHATQVRAGENEGARLVHDHVVREALDVPAWTARADVPALLRFTPQTPTAAGHPRQVNLVVLDAATGRPLQALKLGC